MLGRLRSSAEFERVKREGSYLAGRRCSINVARQATLLEPTSESLVMTASMPSRVGLITSKKIDGNKLKPAFGWFVLVMGIYIITKELFLN